MNSVSRVVSVTAQLIFHVAMMMGLNRFFQVRPTEYLLWVLLIELTFLNYDISNSKK